MLLLDEPLGALDLKLRKQMQTELSRIHRQVGTTFVFVTHDQEEALSMATRIAIMSGGQVIQIGTPRRSTTIPVNRFVADFVGETNFLDGLVTVDDGRPVFALAGGGRVGAPDRLAATGPATLMVRPELLALRRARCRRARIPGITGGSSTSPSWATTPGSRVATAAGDIVAVRPHGTSVRTTHLEEELGEEVCVWWPADDAALIAD